MVKRYYEECMNAKIQKPFDCQRQMDVGSSRSPESLPMKKREEGLKSPER